MRHGASVFFFSALAIAVLNSSIAFGGQWLDILYLPESLSNLGWLFSKRCYMNL